jgi:GAF domain-containing protein
LTRLAAALVDAPVALLTLVLDDRVLFVSSHGLPEPLRSVGQAPFELSICQYAVVTGRPLVCGDTRRHPGLSTTRAVTELGIAAYAGIPLVTPDDWTVGTLCVVDFVRRDWTDDQLAQLARLASICVDEITSQAVAKPA